jgi:histidine ammonia-lyase
MAAHGARRLGPMVRNLSVILGVEAICAAQGIEFRAPLQTSPRLQAAIAALRAEVASLGSDRYLAPDLERAAGMIRSGALIAAAGVKGMRP